MNRKGKNRIVLIFIHKNQKIKKDVFIYNNKLKQLKIEEMIKVHL